MYCSNVKEMFSKKKKLLIEINMAGIFYFWLVKLLFHLFLFELFSDVCFLCYRSLDYYLNTIIIILLFYLNKFRNVKQTFILQFDFCNDFFNAQIDSSLQKFSKIKIFVSSE